MSDGWGSVIRLEFILSDITGTGLYQLVLVTAVTLHYSVTCMSQAGVSVVTL